MHTPISETTLDNRNTRWTLSISKETDLALRQFLALRGMKKGDLSKFVEESINWRVFDLTLSAIRERTADLPKNDLLSLIDEALSDARISTYQALTDKTDMLK